MLQSIPLRNLLVSTSCLVVALLFALQPTVAALTPEQRLDYAYQGIGFIDDVCTEAGEDGHTVAAGTDNAKDAFLYFVGKGLSAHQAAGIVGNLIHESAGVNPRSDQPDGPGMGIAQWSEGGRWEDLKLWAKGKDIFSLRLQLDFLWHEATEVPPWNQTVPAVKAASTVEQATTEFMNKFEKPNPAYANLPKRINDAKGALDAYGKFVPAATAVAECEGVGGIVTTDGYTFPLAPRTKRNYTNMPCNRPVITYVDQFGNTARVKGCHHDGTPAFDLMYPAVPGKAVYAITKGKIINVQAPGRNGYVMNGGAAGKPCGAIQFKADNDTNGDKKYYWYGHILPNSDIVPGKEVDVGTELGVVATQEYGPKCWGGGPHLHIDRGCINRRDEPQQAGNDLCRDPTFVTHLEKIWESLPAEGGSDL
jgi:hypothetical protein